MRRRVGVIVALVLVATACGARVSESQRLAAAGAAPGATGAQAGAATASGGGEVAGPGSAASASPGAVSGAAGGAATQAGLPAGGDNGGSTDVGVTADAINVGTVATLSGPIPGLFQGAAVGAQAFAAYVNSQGGIAGRKLKVHVADDQFDTGQNRADIEDLSKQVLGFLGSFSTFDDAGVTSMQSNGVPDIGYGLTDARRAATVNFSPQPAKSGTFRTGGFEFYARKYPNAVKAMARSTATSRRRRELRWIPWRRPSQSAGSSPTSGAPSPPRPISRRTSSA